ncbi:MAG: 30S ribosomal protein S16 [Gemmatimonadales bacterium]
MATRIRLTRVGRKGVPLYRVVIAERKSARDGRPIATIGTYNPRAKDDAQKFVVDVEAAKKWIANGAIPTDTVANFLKKAGVEV